MHSENISIFCLDRVLFKNKTIFFDNLLEVVVSIIKLFAAHILKNADLTILLEEEVLGKRFTAEAGDQKY
jgi:hypothetical protein